MICDADISEFGKVLAEEEKILPLAYLLSTANTIETRFGNVQHYSPLSYQLKGLHQETSPVPCTCHFKSLPLPNNNFMCDAILEPYFETHLNVSLTEAEEICSRTILQGKTSLWHEKRKFRLCSSSFGLIAKRKTITDKFLQQLFHPADISHIPAIKHGRATEQKAKQEFLRLNGNVHIHPVGLVINPNFPFLGSSPDAVICSPMGMQLLEIKCPFKYRNTSVDCAIGETGFCLQVNSDNLVTLSPRHDYFYQVQGQMMVTGIRECKFFVYTNVDSKCVDVNLDESFCSSLLLKLRTLYCDYCLPFIKKQ